MYSADGNQFKLSRIKNFLISVNNPKTTKDDAKIFEKRYRKRNAKDKQNKFYESDE